jgi:aerobic carbon-monoxide dehydrogenase medium subunit
MKPPDFEYFRPASLTEALGLLGPDTAVLAGGQSLVPLLSMRLAAPDRIVDINRLTELDYVRIDNGHVRVGALARHARVLADASVREAQPLLTKALRFVAHPAVRNRGTVVGSLVHADPAAEMPAVLAVLGGSVRLVSARGERLVPASEFFLGSLESAKQPDELAVEAIFPVLPPGAGTGFAEISRRRGDYAMCGVAVVATDGQARAAYFSVGPVPVVADVSAGPPDLSPPSDIHASADYRRHLAGVLTERALQEATCTT